MRPRYTIPGLIAELGKAYPSAIFIRCLAKTALVSGDVVVLDTTAASNVAGQLTPITTSTGGDDVQALGVVAVGQDTIPSGAECVVQICGLHPAVKIDGTADIAAGDSVSTFTTAGVGDKAAADAVRIGLYVDANYTTNATTALKKVFLTNPLGIMR
jgi:hypothetical protein